MAFLGLCSHFFEHFLDFGIVANTKYLPVMRKAERGHALIRRYVASYPSIVLQRASLASCLIQRGLVLLTPLRVAEVDDIADHETDMIGQRCSPVQHAQ